MKLKNKANPPIVAMIPARMGSTRLKMKNLALLNGKPLIYYAIRAAKDAKVFDRIVINSEGEIFNKIAKRYKVNFYKRPEQFSSSTAKSDFVVYDFLKNNPCDIVAWINSISPFQTVDEINGAVSYFFKNKLDSLITVKDEQVHVIYKNQPVNFKYNEIFAQTQDLMPVYPFVYSLMMWRSKIFISNFEKKGHAFFSGRVGFFPVSKLTGLIIKKDDDLMVADAIMRLKAKGDKYKVLYDKSIRDP